jgi:hypothetical protein
VYGWLEGAWLPHFMGELGSQDPGSNTEPWKPGKLVKRTDGTSLPFLVVARKDVACRSA